MPGVEWCSVQLWGQGDVSAVVPGVEWCAVQLRGQADVSAVVPGVEWCAVQLWGQADINVVVPGVEWCEVQLCTSAGPQCSGARVSTQAQRVCSVQLFSHFHIELWSCTFAPPYTFMVWCLMTDTFPAMLTLCRSNLKPYCMGRKAAFFSAGI